MYDDILLPTDGSAGIEDVIDHAVELAEIHDATVHGLYVVNTASLTDLPMESSWDGLNEALEKEGQTAIAELERRASDVDLQTEIIDGSPSKEIVQYATDEGCDIIVMGTHGRSGVNRLLLGSVAERVVRSGTVPVMTIGVAEGSKIPES
jgi:nucleotide-binding universal stress UspA family protein